MYLSSQFKSVNIKKLVIILAILGGVFSANAQSPEEMKAWQSYMTPSEMHQFMNKYVGDWDIEVKVWMDPSQDPIVSKGTGKTQMILGGRYQQSTFQSDFQGMPFEGMNLMAYDNATKKFISTWFDNMGTGIMITEGTMDASHKKLTLLGSMTEPSGNSVKVKEVTNYISDDRFTMESYHLIEGKEIKMMEGTYQRKK